MKPNVRIIITANCVQIGKTTLARKMVQTWEPFKHKSSSEIVSEVLGQELGIDPRVIIEARQTDPNAYREDLRRVGKRMVMQERYPGVACLHQGFQIVDGIRWLPDLEAMWNYCQMEDLFCVHVHIKGNASAQELANTNSADFEKLADIVLENYGTFAEFEQSMQTTIEEVESIINSL